MQAREVKPQMLHAVFVFSFGRRQKPLLGVIAKVGIGNHEIGVILVGRYFRQMILEHAHRLAHNQDDSELAVGVIVGHHVWSPQKKIVGTPSEARMKLVVHDLGQRGGVDFSRYEGLVGRKRRIHVVVETVVVFLPEMER